MSITQRVLYSHYFQNILFVFAVGTVCLWAIMLPYKSRVICDGTFAPQLQNRLSHITCALSAPHLYRQLKKAIPLVSSVSIRYGASHHATISIKSEQPRLLVRIDNACQDSYVITDQGTVVDKKTCNEAVLEHLPMLAIEQEKKMILIKQQHVISSLLAIKPELFKLYHIVWRSKNEMVLQSLTYKGLLIVTDGTSIHNHEKIAYAESLYKRNGASSNANVKIDIRFKGSLVLEHRGGNT